MNLEVGSGSHAVQTANIMLRFEPMLEKEKPDWLVVVGDVNSTMACTLVASKLGIRVAHVELACAAVTAPCRRSEPLGDGRAGGFVAASVGGWLREFASEGVPDSKIKLVGNIMIDSLVSHVKKAEQAGTLQKLGLKKKEFIYVTLHRPGNVDKEESLRLIVNALSDVAARYPIVFSNPSAHQGSNG